MSTDHIEVTGKQNTELNVIDHFVHCREPEKRKRVEK